MAQTSSNTNVDMYNALTTDELQGAVNRINNHLKSNEEVPLSVIGCKETTYAYDKRPQIVISGKRYYCSIVVKLYQERLKYGDDYKLKVGIDASHFYCHNVHCVNNDHIYFENHKVNKSRLCCRIYGMTMNNYICPHLPKCHINEYTQIKL
jgi:hypothetical protein